jgi:uncharacterized membrane protein YagU involved in acid resistance
MTILRGRILYLVRYHFSACLCVRCTCLCAVWSAVEEWASPGIVMLIFSRTLLIPLICVSDILFLLHVSVPRLQSVKHGHCRVSGIICFFLVRRRKIRLDNASDILRDCSMNVLVATS